MNQYEQIVKTVCCVDWRKAPQNEREGCVGVACLLAYLEGTSATVSALSKKLKISPAEIDIPFKRLLVNGIFSNSYDVKQDKVLLGKCNNTRSTECAWAIIAGIAGGLTGIQ